MREEIILSDYEACDELLRVGGSRNTFIEANCERIETWREFADLGDPRGQVLYGLCFFYGQGVDEDHAIAAQWFEKAAEQGDAQGEFSIGQIYLIEEDHEKAVEWLTKSAEQGNACAQCSLGYCYFNGQGVEEDHEKSVAWYTKSAEQGHTDSQVFVGRCYINGWGVEEDEKTAVEWFTKSAEPYEAQMESSGETWMVDQRNQFLVTGRLSLNGLTSLSDVAAECLGKHAGEDDNLYLNGLTTLSDAAIDSLTSIWNLGFDGFTNLPDTASKSLSKHVGNLYLNGLTNLSDVAAENLSKHKGTLSLNGLRELSDFAAERFGEHEGKLYLDSLTSLSDAAAESLSKHKGSLSLRGLTSLSDAAAESFSKYEEWLTMGLTNVSDAVAESLRMHTGFLSLNGLTTLSDAAAESLRKHEGDLSFGRLVNISDVAAESLAKCYCERCDLNLSMLPASASLILSGPKKKILTLKIAKQSNFFVPFTWIEDDAAQYLANSGKNKLIINDLQSLTDASAAALSGYPGDLRLLGLKDISDTAAQHLAKHSCLTINLDNLPASAAQILRDAGHGE